MKKKALAVLLTGVLAAGILAGCGSTEEAVERPTMEEAAEETSEEEAAPAEEEAPAEEAVEEKGTITVAASPTPHAEILEAAKPILAEQGWNLEVTVFDDYILPDRKSVV